MKLEALAQDFSVCKVRDMAFVRWEADFCFVGKTDAELSLVCETRFAPAATVAREDGWKGVRVAGSMDFSLVGVLSRLSSILAHRGIPIFAVSTYDTDYIFVKAQDFQKAIDAFAAEGYEMSSRAHEEKRL